MRGRPKLTDAEIEERLKSVEMQLSNGRTSQVERSSLMTKRYQYRNRLQRNTGIKRRVKSHLYNVVLPKKAKKDVPSMQKMPIKEYLEAKKRFFDWLWDEKNAS